ncbi:MAG: hypothetical protein Kow0099_31010 [Candidatus Abyssubacteria bacterium]
MPLCLQKSSLVGICLSWLVLASCSAAHYRADADEEVYGIIEEKSGGIEGMPAVFTIEQEPLFPSEELEHPAPIILSLAEALELGVENSREYQTQKELLYSQGLSLTLARHEFDPIFSGTASAEVGRDLQRNSISALLSLGVTKMLATGADLSVLITTNLFRFISDGDPAKTAASLLTARVVQPLLRDGGRDVALENLTQAEREMVYAIRNFVRFRKQLSVNIAKAYYNLLQQKDQVANAQNNYENLARELERAELLAEAGRLPRFQVDQTRQDELRARDRWVREQKTYENLLDDFKFLLGVPTEFSIAPDPAEMENLLMRGTVTPDISLAQAEAIARDLRLDLKNSMGRVVDARRKIAVAANALEPRLDLVASLEAGTEDDTKPFKFDFENGSYSAGFDLELPLDRKAERNAYRQELIDLNAFRRQLTADTDRVEIEVRNAFRSLQQAEQSFEIQQNSLELARRRVESATLLLQAGRASARDMLEAQEDLLEAQNAVSRALVDHFNARLDLFLAMEVLTINDKGLWAVEYGSES